MQEKINAPLVPYDIQGFPQGNPSIHQNVVYTPPCLFSKDFPVRGEIPHHVENTRINLLSDGTVK